MSTDPDNLPTASPYEDGPLVNVTNEERQWGMLCHLSSLIAGGITAATCGLAFPILFVPILYGIIMPIIASTKANNGEQYEYPYTFRLIK